MARQSSADEQPRAASSRKLNGEIRRMAADPRRADRRVGPNFTRRRAAPRSVVRLAHIVPNQWAEPREREKIQDTALVCFILVDCLTNSPLAERKAGKFHLSSRALAGFFPRSFELLHNYSAHATMGYVFAAPPRFFAPGLACAAGLVFDRAGRRPAWGDGTGADGPGTANLGGVGAAGWANRGGTREACP